MVIPVEDIAWAHMLLIKVNGSPLNFRPWIYDIYGENEEAWNKYFNNTSNDSIGELTNLFKNINMDNVQKHITNAQKAVSLIQELTSKNSSNIIS